MAFLQALVIGLIALIIAPGYLFYFDVTPKAMAMLTGAGLMLAAARLKLTSLTVLLLASAISLALSTAFSVQPALSAFGTNWRRLGAVEYAAVLAVAAAVASHAAGRPERVRTILWGVSAAGVVASVYGILQYFGIEPLLPKKAYHIGEGIWTIVRPPSTFGYVSYFANWLVFATFLSLVLASMETRRTLRWAAWSAAGLAGFAILLTGTRAAMLGLAVGAAVALWRRGLSRRTIAVTAAAAFALAAFYYSPPGRNLRSRARWFVEDPRGGARLYLWRDTLRMAAHRPLLGYGPEVFTAQFPRYESVDLAAAYPDFAHESPHNMFLDSLAGQGIPGVVILAAICVIGYRHARNPWLRAALVGGIVTQQFTVFALPTALIFYVTAALAEALTGEARELQPRNQWMTVARVAACAAFMFVAIRMTLADCALELTKQDLDHASVTEAASHYQSYDRWRLPGTSADLWYSRAMTVTAQSAGDPLTQLTAATEAGLAALRATKTSEEPFNAWYNAAQLYATLNDAPRAETSLRNAIAAYPGWFKPHWALARLLQLENRTPEAQREAALAVRLDRGRSSEVVETLRQLSAYQLQE